MMRKVLDVAWLIVMAFLALWAVTSLWWPWGRDQSVMGFMGHLIVDGKMPYVDAVYINAPGGYLLHALLETVSGTARWSLRLLDLGFLALTGWALSGLGKALHSVRAGRWAFAFFVLFYASTGFWHTAQRDGWAAMMLSWGFALTCGLGQPCTRAGRGWQAVAWGKAALAGLLLGLVVLLKPLYLGLALPMLIWVVERGRDSSQPGAPAKPKGDPLWQALVAGALGMSLPLLGVLLWLHRGSALLPAYEQIVLFNSRIYANVQRLDLLSSGAVLATTLFLWGPVLLALTMVGVRYLFVNRVPGRWALAVIWPAVAAAIIVIQGRFFAYHWHGLNMALALLGGVGLMELVAWEARPTQDKPAIPQWAHVAAISVVLALLVIPSGAQMASSIRWWIADIVVARDYGTYLEHFANSDVSPRINAQVGKYLASHTTPNDSIFEWGLEPDLYLYSGRELASPLGGSFFLAATLHRAPDLHQKLLQQLLRDLRRNRPRYFVIVDDDRNPIMQKTSRQALKDEPMLDRYVRDNYRAEITIEHFQLLRIR